MRGADGPKCPSIRFRRPTPERRSRSRPDRVRRCAKARGKTLGHVIIGSWIVSLSFNLVFRASCFARIDNEDAAAVPEGIITTTIGKAINWGRKNSIWPMSLDWRAAPSR